MAECGESLLALFGKKDDGDAHVGALLIADTLLALREAHLVRNAGR